MNKNEKMTLDWLTESKSRAAKPNVPFGGWYRRREASQQQNESKQGWPYAMFWHKSPTWNPLKVQHKLLAFYSVIPGVDDM